MRAYIIQYTFTMIKLTQYRLRWRTKFTVYKKNMIHRLYEHWPDYKPNINLSQVRRVLSAKQDAHHNYVQKLVYHVTQIYV